MSTRASSVAGQLLRHRVQRRLCAPAAATAAGAAVVLWLLAELRPQAVTDAVQLAGLVLALATVTGVTDPAGALADASPTPARRRLVVRVGPVLATVAVGWLVAVAAVPPTLRPPVQAGAVGLAALCALVVAGGVVEARLRPRPTEPVTAAAAVAMGWAALWLLRPSWSPLIADHVGVPALSALAVAAVALAVASGDVVAGPG